MSIYREEILDHYRHPRNFGTLDESVGGVQIFRENVSCGDSQTVSLVIENGVIAKAMFTGTGCAISMAATSLLTDDLVGKTAAAVKALSKDHIMELLGTEINPGRLKCALLGLEAFQDALVSLEASNREAKIDEVTADMNLGEVAAKYPQAAEIMQEYGLHCVGCFASAFDSVEQGAALHGMTPEEIHDMLEQMNTAVRQRPEETIVEQRYTQDNSGNVKEG